MNNDGSDNKDEIVNEVLFVERNAEVVRVTYILALPLNKEPLPLTTPVVCKENSLVMILRRKIYRLTYWWRVM